MSKTRDWDRAGTENTDVFPIQEITDDTGPTSVPMRLVCVAGTDLGRSFRIGAAPAIIGRGEVEIRLTGTDVSRRHARISSPDRKCLLEDLGSVNGTYVNGARIDRAASLQVGDRVQIGNTILIYSHFDELEARMQKLQRVEAMAAMAGGLAHDFRNALQAVVAGVEALDELLPHDATELRQTTNEMRIAATAATALTNRLLNVGRREPTAAYEVVNLAGVVAETIAMARHSLGRDIEVVDRVPAALAVRGSREELHQVFMNLLVNARDAMPSGGSLTISADVVHLERAASLAYHLPSKGDYIALEVADTGLGMDEATLARVFEPFFTTKPVGVGTGLGLTVIHGIIKRHGGSIFVDSAPDRGTTFRIYLPLGE